MWTGIFLRLTRRKIFRFKEVEMAKIFLALMAAYVLAIGTVVYLAAPVVSGYMEKFDQAIWEMRR